MPERWAKGKKPELARKHFMLKPNVLRNKKDFSSLYNKGKSAGGKYVVLFYRKNNLPYNRRAALASKKVGNSVKRNRARRLIKESYRLMEGMLPKGHDILIIARAGIADAGVKRSDVEKSIKRLMEKTGLIGNGTHGKQNDRSYSNSSGYGRGLTNQHKGGTGRKA